ncbi:MAG: transglycosylase SLT domain-containing protein [Acidobacteriota bacterium]|nr:transglycosylase SLT domain-containing protein [Acidobacteriota bacterium]
MLRRLIHATLLLFAPIAFGRVPAAHRALSNHSPISLRLKVLSERAKTPRGWRALHRFAGSTHVSSERGLAWFVLGYREYLAGQDGLAASHLGISASIRSPLQDYAAYFEAQAEARSNRSEDALGVIEGFSARFPGSVYQIPAANLQASLLIKTGNPQRALEVIQMTPGALTKPSAMLLAAEAEEALHNNAAASRDYQKVSNDFPLSPESQTAATALRRLRMVMGADYPEPSLEVQTRRASIIFEKGQYQDALASFDQLQRDHPGSSLRGEWRLARAQCLIRMRQYSEALTALAQPEQSNSETDARRLALKTEVCELSGDQSALIKTLDEIYAKYPLSQSYGDALAYAGGYYARQGLWRSADQYYQTLSRSFPRNRYALEASWRAAWYKVLSEDWQGAAAAFIEFLRRYPQSQRAQAALYWLADSERRNGDVARADEIDHLLGARYANTYYGLKAREKVATTSMSRRPDAARNPALAFLSGQGINIVQRPRPPISFCGEGDSSELLLPYSTLISLSLDTLGTQYLANIIALHPKDPCLDISVAHLRNRDHDDALAILDARKAVPNYDEYPFAALPESVWKIFYPTPYWNLVRRYARANRLNPYMVMGLIRQESAFNPHATSAAHARGLMQMEPYTAIAGVRGRWRRRRVIRDLYSPAFNIRISCRYLRDLLRSFNGNLPAALASYNAGDDRVRLWIENSKIQDPAMFLETIPFTDTRAYVEEILRDSMIYRRILTGTTAYRHGRAR